MAKTKKAKENVDTPVVETNGPTPTAAPYEPPQPEPVYSAPVLTQNIVTAKFNRELSLIKFQSTLQGFIDWKVTEDNVPESQAKTKEARGLITKVKDVKARLKKPALDECDMWETAFKSVLAPLESALKQKDADLQVISQKIAAENLRKQQEKERVERINKEIDNFILDQSRRIAEATNTEQLVAVEKMIGSHKGNQSRYAEFLPKLAERCGELTPLIKAQKEIIKNLEDLKKQQELAEKEGDDRKILELQERGEQLNDSLEEKKLQVQETAIHQATRPDEVTTPEPVITNIKPRRRSWAFDIVDEKKAFAAGMLICELNKDKVKEKLETIKNTIQGKEIIVDGIKYSYVETY